MILQRLAEHYDRLTAIRSSSSGDNTPPSQGYLRQKVSFCVVLNPDGSLNDFQSLQDQKGRVLLPSLIDIPGVAKSSGPGLNPSFLWDNAAYMLGFRKNDPKPARTQEEFAAFRDWHLSLQSTINAPSFDAVCIFLSSWSEDSRVEHQAELASLATSFGVFRIAGTKEYLHDLFPQILRPQKKTTKKFKPGDTIGFCLVTGNKGLIARLHKPPIKGVTNGQSSGAPFVSFNWRAAWSYGKENSYNAPVSEVIAAKYSKALNLLLDRRDRRVQLGDSTVVYWADRAHPLEEALSDLFVEPYMAEEAAPEEDRNRVREAQIYLTQLRDGTQLTQIVDDGELTKFFMLGLSPNASRLSVRLWVEADVSELQRRLGQHLRDIALGYAREDKPLTLRRIADATGRAVKEGKQLFDTKGTSPQLAGDLARSVLMGAAYPQSLLTTMLRRIRCDGEVAYARVAAIKGCLVRNSRLRGHPLEVSNMLETNNISPAYCCGRAFAMLEAIQQSSADGELNRTIKDSYFSSASATPALVFPRLIRLSQHHLAKLPIGSRIYYEKLLGEVLGKLTVFPRHLSIEDQGKFVLGYFHQRQDLFTSKKDKAEGATQ